MHREAANANIARRGRAGRATPGSKRADAVTTSTMSTYNNTEQEVVEQSRTEPEALRKQPATPACFRTMRSGYERWHAYNRRDGQDSYYVHRLVAVAEWGVDAIRGRDVHHKNGIPWDNRPENLEVLTRKEHREVHGGVAPSHKVSEAELVEDLKAGAAALGRPPTWDEYNTFGEYSAQTVSRRFGGWGESLAAAGLAEGLDSDELERLYFEGGDGR